MSDAEQMKIPDEAVEAAARSLNDAFPQMWEKMPEWAREDERKAARAALEAALTHMLAGPHPTMSSAVTAASNAHIAICPQCQETFG